MIGGDYDPLHDRLTILVKKTEGADSSRVGGGWWVGDIAGQRQAYDDLAAGRLQWQQANRFAHQGLEALKNADRETASICAWAATDCYVAALEIRVRPSDMRVLKKPAAKRGRPPKKSSK
ncbi:hypothetical protein [Mesorhizobium sp.]|uniref:hypothetical protein n=1 Tax=Mesorhizobium sp. TaxID=1871066 RepID=UPI000FEA126C|nr:hypothetical protein [Mesorhizobium sp.]RWO51022.1 MAG: hypothetical protein EOS13_21690 [Mesorhizobium sp.]